METCVRGFSFMPNSKVDVVDLQYIEEAELERTWKSTRRERQKQREQKIWEEFVKENDIVNSVCEDDQYQFLEKLPDKYVKELMETDLQKLKAELKAGEENKVRVQTPAEIEKCSISSSSTEPDDQPCVTFADVTDGDDADVFRIFDEDKDEQSGMEDGPLNDSQNSPPTVRERNAVQSPVLDVSLERPSSDVNTSSTGKSSENVTNVIESSIYCAKVKDLRIKINDEILEIICSYDRRDIYSVEREDITRMIRRSGEFCARFNRIYMYQLQRQMHDIKRNNNLTLPFAKHTQFQSQMIRVVSLHQNLLQAFQVYHKSVEQTWCEKESMAALKSLLGTARSVTELCVALTQPRDLSAATLLYQDNLLSSCDKLEEFVNKYTLRCEQLLKGLGNINLVDRRKETHRSMNNKNKKRPIPQRSNTKTVSESEAKLSMYSLDRLRLNTKQSSSRDMQSGGTSRGQVASIYNKNKLVPGEKEQQPKKKSPRNRRPLMRDPQAGRHRPRGPRPQRARDADVHTMVEQVEPCASSRDTSVEPVRRTKAITPRTNRTPRNTIHNIVRKSQANTPRKIRQHSPKLTRSPSPKMKSTLNSILSDKQVLESIHLIPPNKVQNSKKKGNKVEKDLDRNIYDGKIASNVGSCQLREPNSEKSSSRLQIPNSPKQTSSRRTETTVLPEPSPNPELTATQTDKKEHDRNKVIKPPEQCEVTKLLQQLCSGDASGNRADHSGNAKNAQLLYMQSSSPRPHPTTPQLLRILEETIQKKVPKSLQQKCATRDIEKYRMLFNLPERVTDNLFQYRTKFVQHMLTSPMYANSAVGKPWEMIGSISEQIIDEVLLNCVKEMELSDLLHELYKQETKSR